MTLEKREKKGTLNLMHKWREIEKQQKSSQKFYIACYLITIATVTSGCKLVKYEPYCSPRVFCSKSVHGSDMADGCRAIGECGVRMGAAEKLTTAKSQTQKEKPISKEE